MKLFYIFGLLLINAMITTQATAQVNLPLDASNCAILNALSPQNQTQCMETNHLGEARGLVVNVSSLNDGSTSPQSLGETPAVKSKAIKKNRIDHKAAKSDSGYYIHFAFNSEALEKEYRAHLDRLAIVLKTPAMAKNCVRITGHTDTVGSADYNLKLSDRRAKTVFNYLASLDGINKDRLSLSAFGETRPLPEKPGTSPFNRRVEFSSKADPKGCSAS